MNELDSINLRLKVLDTIIKEAQANGDERWREAARQADELNEQRATLIKKQKHIEPVTVNAIAGTSGVKTHGRG